MITAAPLPMLTAFALEKTPRVRAKRARTGWLVPCVAAALVAWPLWAVAESSPKPHKEAAEGHSSKPEPEGAKDAKSAPKGEAAGPGKPAAAMPRGQDPLDVLHDRLSKRLGATPASSTVAAPASRAVQVSSRATGEFQVAANATTHAPKSRPAGERASRSSAQAEAHGAPSEAASHHHDHWSYVGASGPQNWAELRPAFSLCGRGQRQSPIDIRDGYAVELEPVLFDYRPSGFRTVNTGHSLQADMAPGNRIEVGGRSFELVQLHFHNPAEERVNGRSFAMSAHLVHKDSEGRLAVVTVLLDRGAAQPAVQVIWNHLPLEIGISEPGRVELNLNELLPVDRRYYTYMGSLTTPPCTEGVQWIVLKQPVSLSQAQHDFFARLYPMNARPLQAASGRIIKQSQ